LGFDYRTITPERVATLTDEAIAAADLLLANAATASPTSFEGTVQPIDDADALVYDASGRGAFMARVHPEAAVRDAGQAAETRIRTWQAALPGREDLARAVRAYAETDAARELTGQHRRLLDHLLRDFRRAGQDLPAEQRAEAGRLRSQIVELEVAFQRNIDEWQDGLDLTREALDGLPEDYVGRLAPGATDGTYRVTLAYPDYYPFLENARRRDLRQELERRFFNRAVTSNRPVIAELLGLRRQLAHVLGYASWADYAVEVKMAGTPGRVWDFLNELIPPLADKTDREIETMSALLASDTGDTQFRSWDWRYYDSQLLRNEYSVDQDEVAEYFPLDAVLDGLFGLSGEVFGLDYRELPEPTAWHPDVRLFQVLDRPTGRLLGTFYVDLFPREGKFGHAMAWPITLPRRAAAGSQRADELPEAAIVANIPPPTTGAPSLVQHSDVEMLFHEFGHILHEIVSEAQFARFSIFQVEPDFEEAPSQIMQHWTWQPSVLRQFARHHRTGAPIPEDLVDRLIAARDVNVGLKTLFRLCRLSVLDLELHTGDGPDRIDEIHRETFGVTRLPFHEGTFDLAAFGHIVGGYDAGYYGYIWSKVYGDDMWSRFEREGITDPAVGGSYRREILEPSASRDADEMLRRFLGREPSNATFLKLLGLVPA